MTLCELVRTLNQVCEVQPSKFNESLSSGESRIWIWGEGGSSSSSSSSPLFFLILLPHFSHHPLDPWLKLGGGCFEGLLTINLSQIFHSNNQKRVALVMNVHEKWSKSEEKETLLDQFIIKCMINPKINGMNPMDC